MLVWVGAEFSPLSGNAKSPTVSIRTELALVTVNSLLLALLIGAELLLSSGVHSCSQICFLLPPPSPCCTICTCRHRSPPEPMHGNE